MANLEEMNSLVECQKEIKENILKIQINAKKDSAARKSEEYYKTRTKNLEEYWKQAQENQVRILKCNVSNHDYYVSNQFDQIRNDYENVKKFINENKKHWEETKSTEAVDKNQELRLKEQEVRMEQLNEAISRINEELLQDKPFNRYEFLLKKISKQWEGIVDKNIEIRMHEITFKNPYFGNNEYRNLEEIYEGTIEKLEKKLKTQTTTDMNTRSSHINLPQVKIPVFDGTYEEWATFEDMFSKLIHNNINLANVEKMQYLKTHVKSEASRVIQHFQITDSNYEAAWEQLRKRYSNKRLTLSILINKMIDFAPIHQESANKIKELHDTATECLEAVKALGIDTTSWGPILNCILVKKLDSETNRQYELSVKNPLEIQDFTELLEFLRNRFQSLEAVSQSMKKHSSPVNRKMSCKYCRQSHPIYLCDEFKKLSVQKRFQIAKEAKICFVCLSHEINVKCTSQRRCHICNNQSHHTLLHREQDSTYNQKENQTKKPTNVQNKKSESTTKASSHVGVGENHSVFLATALIRVKTISGNWEYLRALVDPGSQVSLITEQAASLLSLPRQRIRASISGLGGDLETKSNHMIEAQCRPRFPSNFVMNTQFVVLPKLTGSLPDKELTVNLEQWNNLILADPTFFRTGPIDVLLGAKQYYEIILDGLRKPGDGTMGQNTEFGWVLSGCSTKQLHENIKVISMTIRSEEQQQLNKFWELEEICPPRYLTQEEVACEQHFEETTTREEKGQYTVQIPFKTNNLNLGNSRSRAMARFIQLEKRLSKNEEMNTAYKQFMQEYIELGHMRKVPTCENGNGKYYIPHQPVIRESSTTTKLKVVFDASCKTSTGTSLNDVMHVGPKLQQELSDILLRWRSHQVAFSADIEKMYRQIKMHIGNQDFQRILWRFDVSESIHEYNLTTVTYGTASAPYLAIKTLQKLARDEEKNFPRASKVACRDFYVDDVLSGADNEDEALQLQEDLIKMMKSGGFTLRKWSSNKTALLASLPEDLREQKTMEIKQDETTKSLGVLWAPYDDTIRFKVDLSRDKISLTKRTLLSEVARVFDPLGWLAPIIIQAKLIIQEIWLKNLSWDDPIPTQIQERWIVFRDQLQCVEQITLSRWTHQNKTSQIEVHGFCDASEKAYGAVVYMKATNSTETKITLLTAKSKVAPIKTKTTLPRLELCAAVLLARLMKKVITTMEISNPNIFAWTDSMITLSWIRGSPTRWKTFVANRVSEIQQLLPTHAWNHIKSEENTADLISRGLDPKKLKDCKIWWEGPVWLKKESYNITRALDLETIPEEKKICHQVTIVHNENEICEKFSSLTKMIRIVAFCNRFIKKCKKKRTETKSLKVTEMESALKKIISSVQATVFRQEIKSLQNNRTVEKPSKLATLHPFLDKDGLLRVGGRLQHSLLKYAEKHAIILPYDSHLTKLVVWDERNNVSPGEVVILKEDHASPGKWPSARIKEVHPDPNGITRVVTLQKSGGGTLKRPIHKLILLPNEENGNKPNLREESTATNVAIKKNFKTTSWNLIAMLLLGIFTMANATIPYNVEYPKPGMYIEQIGNAKINRGIFRIEVKFEKKKLDEDVTSINQVINQIDQFCKKSTELSTNTECLSLIHHLREKEQHMGWIRKGLDTAIRKRQRRGLLGELLTSVFGVNDEVYKDIEALEKNQHELIKASNHQTKFMLQALSTFNETEVRIFNKLNHFRKKLNQGLEAINEMQKWYRTLDENKLGFHLLGTYQVAANYIDELLDYYKNLLDIHYDSAHFYEFITPGQIEEIVETASRKLPSNIHITSYPILKTEVQHSKENIHIFGYFTMAETNEFMVIKATPIPLKVTDNAYWILNIPKEFIAVDYDTQQYFQMTEEELRNSIQLTSHLFICSPAMIHDIENSPNCVIDEIFQRTENVTCAVQEKKFRSMVWKQLYTLNSWLFISPRVTKIAVICNGARKDVSLNRTGLITVSDSCIITTNRSVLTPKRIENVPVIASFAKPVVVSLHSAKHFKLQKLPVQEPIVKPSDDLMDLKEVEENIQEGLSEENWKSVRHHSALTSILTVAAVFSVLLLVVIMVRQGKKLCKKEEKSKNEENVLEMEPVYAEMNGPDPNRPEPED